MCCASKHHYFQVPEIALRRPENAGLVLGGLVLGAELKAVKALMWSAEDEVGAVVLHQVASYGKADAAAPEAAASQMSVWAAQEPMEPMKDTKVAVADVMRH